MTMMMRWILNSSISHRIQQLITRITPSNNNNVLFHTTSTSCMMDKACQEHGCTTILRDSHSQVMMSSKPNNLTKCSNSSTRTPKSQKRVLLPNNRWLKQWKRLLQLPRKLQTRLESAIRCLWCACNLPTSIRLSALLTMTPSRNEQMNLQAMLTTLETWTLAIHCLKRGSSKSNKKLLLDNLITNTLSQRRSRWKNSPDYISTMPLNEVTLF